MRDTAEELANALVDVTQRLIALERRLGAMVRPGVVEDVDPAKGLMRLRFGGTDDKPFLGPWVPYGQVAGALKIHAPPSKGQQMMQVSAAGDFAQGLAMPMTWSDKNVSPSQAGDANVITFGGFTISLKGNALSVTGQDVAITGNLTVTGDVKASGGVFTHEGKDIGATHRHLEVQKGPDRTGVPA